MKQEAQRARCCRKAEKSSSPEDSSSCASWYVPGWKPGKPSTAAAAAPMPRAVLSSPEEGKVLLRLPRAICSSLSHRMRRSSPLPQHTALHMLLVFKTGFEPPLVKWSRCLSHLPLSGRSRDFFFYAIPKKFSIFILSAFASSNFQVLCIPVFWMCMAEQQPELQLSHCDHLNPDRWTQLMRRPVSAHCTSLPRPKQNPVKSTVKPWTA